MVMRRDRAEVVAPEGTFFISHNALRFARTGYNDPPEIL